MGDLTRNLSRHEFACKCGKTMELGYCASTFDCADIQLIYGIQGCADHFAIEDGREIGIGINSGNRCKKHNKDEGGTELSQHTTGKAADFFLFYRDTGNRVDSDRVADYLCEVYPDRCGIGRYHNRTHLDFRKSVARWDHR